MRESSEAVGGGGREGEKQWEGMGGRWIVSGERGKR